MASSAALRAAAMSSSDKSLPFIVADELVHEVEEALRMVAFEQVDHLVHDDVRVGE
jgi:hypothetical protein